MRFFSLGSVALAVGGHLFAIRERFKARATDVLVEKSRDPPHHAVPNCRNDESPKDIASGDAWECRIGGNANKSRFGREK